MQFWKAFVATTLNGLTHECVRPVLHAFPRMLTLAPLEQLDFLGRQADKSKPAIYNSWRRIVQEDFRGNFYFHLNSA